ncbi:MAG: DNA polymerase III subunit delta [Rhodothermales bacterium]
MAKTGLTYEQLDTAFRHRNFQPLYFLYGEETFLMDELQQVLIKHALAPHERDFNLDLVYSAETDAPSVLALCAGFPMMAERRVVIVRNFDKLKDNRLFKAYAERPNPTAVVLLLCRSRPNLAAHPYRALRQHAAWGEFKTLYTNQMPGWIQQRVKTLGYRIEPQAVQRLADYVGTNLQSAAAEIEKLITYAGGRSTLTADDVVRAGGQTREFNVFELQRAIGEDRYQDALRIAERLLAQASNARGEALMIVSVLTSYFTKLWKLTACRTQRIAEKEMAQRVGVSPYFIKEYLFSLRHFPPQAIEQAFAALLAADYELKGGSSRDERLILVLLLRRLVPRGGLPDARRVAQTHQAPV